MVGGGGGDCIPTLEALSISESWNLFKITVEIITLQTFIGICFLQWQIQKNPYWGGRGAIIYG